MSPIDYGLVGLLAAVVIASIVREIWLHSANNTIQTLRDTLDGKDTVIDTITDERDALKVDNDRLKPALNTSERLLVAANARISELLDQASAAEKARIDVAPLSDLIAESRGVLPSSAASHSTGTGDDHDPSKGVPRTITSG